MIKQFEICIYGRVQGVGFRYSARNQARLLNLKGWIENRADGSVRSVIQGGHEDCMEFIRWCRKGPGYSWVEKIEVSENRPGELTAFSVRR